MAASMDLPKSDKFAIEFVNDRFKNDIKSLRSVKEIYGKYKEEKRALEGRVSVTYLLMPGTALRERSGWGNRDDLSDPKCGFLRGSQ